MEMGVQVGVTDLIPLLPVPPSPTHISHSHLLIMIGLDFLFYFGDMIGLNLQLELCLTQSYHTKVASEIIQTNQD